MKNEVKECLVLENVWKFGMTKLFPRLRLSMLFETIQDKDSKHRLPLCYLMSCIFIMTSMPINLHHFICQKDLRNLREESYLIKSRHPHVNKYLKEKRLLAFLNLFRPMREKLHTKNIGGLMQLWIITKCL